MTSTTVFNFKKIPIKILKAALTGIFWLGLWQLIYMAVGKDVLVASPSAVARRLCSLIPSAQFWLAVGQSFLGIAKGYLLGVATGILAGIATAFSKTLSALLKPFLTAIKTTPVVSFIILALVWLEKLYVPVFITFLMVMPVIWANVASGIIQTDKNLVEMANAYSFNFRQKLRLIFLPSAVPSFVTACETAVGLGWKAGIAAEVLCTPENSIGINLKNSQVYIETADLFAWTAVVIIISLLLEKALVAFLHFLFGRIMKKGGYFIEN